MRDKNQKKELLSKARTVIIVDDDPSVCESIADLISHHGIGVSTYCSSRLFLDEFIPADQPIVIVMDLLIPALDGLKVQSYINEKHGLFCPIIFLTGHPGIDSAVSGMRAGAFDYLQKPVNPEQLMETIERAFQLAEEKLRERTRKESLAVLFNRLTPREQEISQYICKGFTAKMIGRALGISPRTAEIHRSRILEKLAVKNAAELVALAIKMGIHEPDPQPSRLDLSFQSPLRVQTVRE